ncbi:MAG TPA: cupin domain-containing protein [Lentimicrobium sp.]|nr:cupin domain-containing protein [Lentimicrobium sp.]
MIKLRNLFEVPLISHSKEVFEVLVDGNTLIERIISVGHKSPEDQWYDQENDEWVVLLEGEARIFFEETGELMMKKGDYILIKAHEKHRINYTSTDPPCIWLAVHGNLDMKV